MPRAAQAQEPAESADDFVERVGVSTHFGQAAAPYGAQFEDVKRLLGELGVRHVRDSVSPHTTDIYNALGAKTTALLLPPDVKAAVKLAAENQQRLDMVEGQGRANTSGSPQSSAFAERDALFPKALYDALQAEPTTATIPVLASLDAATVPGQTTIAGLNGTYAEGIFAADAALLPAYDRLASGQALKPLVAVVRSLSASVQMEEAAEQAQAKQILRQYARGYEAGLARTFAGDLVDETVAPKAASSSGAIGLLRGDLTPRPSYKALKNFLALLSERSWVATTQRWMWEPVGFDTPGRRALYRTPKVLDFTLTGRTAGALSLHHVLLQKQTGDYFLLLWQENAASSVAGAVSASTEVTLAWKMPMRGGSVYDPVAGSDPTQIFSGTAAMVTLPVSDSVTVVQLTPQDPWAGKPLVTIEDSLSAQTTQTTAHLSWRPGKDMVVPAGYFVSRLGRYLGRTTTPEFDESGLRPGIGYPYTIRAYTADGNVGPPVSVIATTKN